MSNRVKKVISSIIMIIGCIAAVSGYLYMAYYVGRMLEPENDFLIIMTSGIFIAILLVMGILCVVYMCDIIRGITYGPLLNKIDGNSVARYNNKVEIIFDETFYWRWNKKYSKANIAPYGTIELLNYEHTIDVYLSGNLKKLRYVVYFDLREGFCAKTIESIKDRISLFGKYSGEVKIPIEIEMLFAEFEKQKSEYMYQFDNSAVELQQRRFDAMVKNFFLIYLVKKPFVIERVEFSIN